MFEISAKAYCDDHKTNGGPSALESNGSDRKLAFVLNDIYQHMISLPNQKKDAAKMRALHGASVELGKAASVLSVTSMNNLIHNPRFSVTAGDVSSMFGNVFPFLEEMNS
jgi:hypothetical protein